MTEVCLTIDVEDWYDGMAVLGHPLPKPEAASSGLAALGRLLDGPGDQARMRRPSRSSRAAARLSG